MNEIMRVVDVFKPQTIKVFGSGAVEIPAAQKSFRLVGFSLVQFGVALAARGYTTTVVGQGYCRMEVYHAQAQA